jgi:hypothetical protein
MADAHPLNIPNRVTEEASPACHLKTRSSAAMARMFFKSCALNGKPSPRKAICRLAHKPKKDDRVNGLDITTGVSLEKFAVQ